MKIGILLMSSLLATRSCRERTLQFFRGQRFYGHGHLGPHLFSGFIEKNRFSADGSLHAV